MIARYKTSIKQCLVLLAALITAIAILDQVIAAMLALWYHNDHWTWGSRWLLNGVNPFAPSFNDTWRELWFAETLAFIVMPVALILLRKRIKAPLLPWVLVAAWAVWGLTATLVYYNTTFTSVTPPNTTYQLHSGARLLFNRGLMFDGMLESELPFYLGSQVVPFGIIGVGYLISYGTVARIERKQ